MIEITLSARFPSKVCDVLSHRRVQAPMQQLFESRRVAALHQQDQKNVVLLRGHREILIPYIKRDEHARTVRMERSFFQSRQMHTQRDATCLQSVSAGVLGKSLVLASIDMQHMSHI